MKIAVASDHAGYDLKIAITQYLTQKGIPHHDFGSGPGEEVDYVDLGALAVDRVLVGEYDRAILFCGTGLGMAIVANKFKGIRATPCWDEYTARVSRSHNNSNCLTLGGRVIAVEKAIPIVEVWLNTEFEGGRHERRIEKIGLIEAGKFKP